MFLAGTSDARGYNQWQAENRHVRKGAKALHILVPKIIKHAIEDTDEEGEENEENKVLTGFMVRPVFRFEDTEGEPLDYEKQPLPDLPLISKAEEWNISVKCIPGNYKYFGYFSSRKLEIDLASKEESVFFHELAHAAHGLLLKRHGQGRSLEKTPEWEKEIVAELAAAAHCRIVGKTSKYTQRINICIYDYLNSLIIQYI
jgi:antirestriction protein ArdC